MNKLILIAAVLPLAGCLPSDQQIARAQAKHREYVCTHQQSVTLAANLAIQNADKIKDQRVRDAAIMAANVELAIVAKCPAVG